MEKPHLTVAGISGGSLAVSARPESNAAGMLARGIIDQRHGARDV